MPKGPPMKRAILTTAAAVAALLALTFAIVVVAAFGNTDVRPLTTSRGTITLTMFFVALVALLIAAAAAEWTGWARPGRRDASPNHRATADSWKSPSQRVPPARPQMTHLRPAARSPSHAWQSTGWPRRSRAPLAPSANPTARPSAAASPPVPDPVPQAVESPTTVVTLAAALEASPRSDKHRRRLVRKFREAARVAAAPSEPDPLSTPEPRPEAGPLPSSEPAEVLRQTADPAPAVERPPRQSSSGRVRRHLTWLIQRQRGRCGICGQPLLQPPTGDVVHVDHIVPLVQGGSDQRSNLQAAHAACNLAKGSLGARRPPPGYSSTVLPPH